ncbi:MAG: hypothetical protein IAI48_00080 [Candidatus Eremiobacteraeota bacterium]|nr:hypothetical protein [Candidatus Eremiobacteraeota bacterium]
MAESDRKRLLERALALREATHSDFFGGRAAPDDADPALLKLIEDTSLRTKLLDARIAEGLQSPKGPQKIASIVRIYPDFDAPARNGVTRRGVKERALTPVPTTQRGLPTVDEMERLIARIREVEADVEHEMSAQLGERVERLKRSLGDLDGPELESTVRELSAALEEKRALASHIRFEAFKRVERDGDFAPRTFLRLLAR